MNLSDIGVIEDSVLSVVFGPILRLLTASRDKTAKVWSAASGECLRTLEDHTACVNPAVFSPDGQQLMTTSDDKTAKVCHQWECCKCFGSDIVLFFIILCHYFRAELGRVCALRCLHLVVDVSFSSVCFEKEGRCFFLSDELSLRHRPRV